MLYLILSAFCLGYLRDEHLDEAYNAFCRSSKYLKEEYELVQNGVRPIYVHDRNLLSLVREYGEIKEIGML